MGVIYKDKGYALLLFKIFHKPDLMLMYIGKGKCICVTFLGVKAYGNALNCTYVVYSILRLNLEDLLNSMLAYFYLMILLYSSGIWAVTMSSLSNSIL